jgi:hypothetical protein
LIKDGREEAIPCILESQVDEKTFVPNVQNHRIYTQLFNDVYKKLFRTMEPIYRRIAQITGYPDEDEKHNRSHVPKSS